MSDRIERKTLSQEVLDSIRKKILTGDIEQGSRIKEIEIAERLGVSRGLVRESFRQLEKEGLIEYSTNKGCNVRYIYEDEADEICMLRSNLEALAINLCDGKFSDETIKRMEEAVANMTKYAKENKFYELILEDQKFHGEIVLAAKKRRLFELWDSLSSLCILMFYTTIEANRVPADLQGEFHGKILDVIKTKDKDKMIKTLGKHIMDSSKLMDTREQSEQ